MDSGLAAARRSGMTIRDTVQRGRIRPAWVVLGGAFGAFTLSAALMHSYPVYLVAFIADFGWSRAETSIAYSVSQLVGGASSPLVGYLVDRLGSRRLLFLGGGLLVVGLLASAFVTALWEIVVLYGVVMTIGANCLGLVVFVPMLSRYFIRNRGMAISIVQSANGIARGLSAPLVQLLISLIGWRSTYLVQAGLMGVLVLPLAALFRRAEAPPAQLQNGAVLGMGAFLAVPGIVVTGTLSDYIGREWSAILAYGFSIIGVVFALMITSPDQHLLLWLHACFFGLTWGARGPAITAKTADLFPGRQLGTILGVITIGSGVGSAVGSWGAGWIYDLSGSYRVAFIASIVSYAAGVVAFWALRRPPARNG